MTKSDKLDWQIPEAGPDTVRQWMSAGDAVLVDVRETHEYEYEHIPGSLLLPLSFLDPAVFPPLHSGRLVMVCAVGRRSAAACKQLAQAGFRNVVNMKGGLRAWQEAGLETRGGRFDTEDYTI